MSHGSIFQSTQLVIRIYITIQSYVVVVEVAMVVVVVIAMRSSGGASTRSSVLWPLLNSLRVFQVHLISCRPPWAPLGILLGRLGGPLGFKTKLTSWIELLES